MTPNQPAPHSLGPMRTLSGHVHPGPYQLRSPRHESESPRHPVQPNSAQHQPSTNGISLQRTPSFSSLSQSSSSQTIQESSFPFSPTPRVAGQVVTENTAVVSTHPVAYGTVTPAFTDSVANLLQLSDEGRITLHKFSQASPAEQNLFTQAQGLKGSEQKQEIINILRGMNARLDGIEERTSEGWQMTKIQEDLGKGIVAHWLMKPLNGYGKQLNRSVDKYISQNADRLHLKLYNTDPVVKKTVEKFVNAQQTVQRSNMHRGLAESINKGETLDEYSLRMVRLHSLGNETKASDDVKGQFALMRSVHMKIISSGRNKAKGDSGFWKEMDAELSRLVQENGRDRKSTKWQEWNTMMIAEDVKKFGSSEDEELPGLNLDGDSDTYPSGDEAGDI